MQAKMKIMLALTLTGAVMLTGCASTGPNQQFGSLAGGVLGGWAGHNIGGGSGRTAATILGTVVGSQIGSNAGAAMDNQQRMQAYPQQSYYPPQYQNGYYPQQYQRGYYQPYYNGY